MDKNLFDYAEAVRQRDAGMQIAAINRAEILERAKQVAVQIAMLNPKRICNIDLVRYAMESNGLGDLGMAAGSVFRGKHWEYYGTKKSERITSHGRDIKVWRLI